MKTTRYNSKCKCGTFTSELVSDETFRAAEEFDGYIRGVRREGPHPTRFVRFQGSSCITCRGCGALRYAQPVKGRVNLKHECNAKCLSSHGFVCECSCGGKNHGAANV